MILSLFIEYSHHGKHHCHICYMQIYQFICISLLSPDGSVLDLPRLSRPPGITGVTSTSAQVVFSPWHRDTDDGSSAFPITGYRVRYRTDQDADWQEADSSDSHGGGKWEKESMGVTDQGGARVTMISDRRGVGRKEKSVLE